MSEDVFALPTELVQTEVEKFVEEAFPMLDPDQVEKEHIEKFNEMQENMPAHDVASHFFKMYYPVYCQLLSGLSNKDAKRVAQHIAQWPLEEENPHFYDEKAKQAFAVGIRLIDCKMIMRTYVEMEKHLEIHEKKQAEEAAKQNATVVAEENNDGKQV